MSTWWALVPSPVDDLLLTTDGEHLTRVLFSPHKGVVTSQLLQAHWHRDDSHFVLTAAALQLGEYFAGERRTFDVPLHASGTPFQLRVWDELRQIPFGETRSYGDIAVRLGAGAGGSRAVGLANGANPLSVVVPCHRVIGANGALTGFGGGLPRKRFLLDLEADQLF